jgi:hypothetical protein
MINASTPSVLETPYFAFITPDYLIISVAEKWRI